MSSKPEDTKNAKPQAKKEKKTETTILTPEELRAISGGIQQNSPPPVAGPNDIVAGNKKTL
jgi:hypothetical protein